MLHRRGLLIGALGLFVPIKPAQFRLPGYVGRLKVGSIAGNLDMRRGFVFFSDKDGYFSNKLASLKWEPVLEKKLDLHCT